jgi:menaquinone-dependent protoporphyrinogen oxidase
LKNILITYATYTGSAQIVAELVSLYLVTRGVNTVLMPMIDVKDLKGYDAVIAGSAIHSGRWLPEAFDFLELHKEALNSKPFAAFLVCMTMAMKKNEKYRQFVSGFMIPVREIVKPVCEGLFAGRLEIKKIHSLSNRIKFRISVAAGIWKEGDHLNKYEITKWSEEVYRKIVACE